MSGRIKLDFPTAAHLSVSCVLYWGDFLIDVLTDANLTVSLWFISLRLFSVGNGVEGRGPC